MAKLDSKEIPYVMLVTLLLGIIVILGSAVTYLGSSPVGQFTAEYVSYGPIIKTRIGYHTECANETCVAVPGSGANQCSSNSDCVVETHNICSYGQCTEVTGAGTDECSVNSDCRHNICWTNTSYNGSLYQCIPVYAPGTNECTTSADCY
ncbi:MAG: hypothetical protein JSW73_05345 [Candidatus Woesearchaeota archaeon]|nr:MAG: hypothetical protein JSW73_05345 [Candidatus Woesearchaeota archaeon]